MQQGRRISEIQGNSAGRAKSYGDCKIGRYEGKKNHMNVMSNSESFTRQSSLNLALTFRPYLFTDGLDYFWWGWNKNAVYRRKVHTRDDFLTRIVDAGA